jgi:serine/threonine protein kinase
VKPPAKIEKQATSASEVAIAYRPECNTNNLREFLQRHAKLIGFFIFLSPIVSLISFGVLFFLSTGTHALISFVLTGKTDSWAESSFAYILAPLLVLPFTIPFGLKMARIVLQPTHLLVCPDGLYVQWRQRLQQPRKLLARWSELSYLDLEMITDRTKMSEQYIVLRQSGEKEARVKISGILESRDRIELLKAIRSWAPEVPRNPEITSLLEPQPETSYTELWLSALTSASDRVSLTPLAEGALLKEGKYRICRKIAMGGQGTAYAALRLDLPGEPESAESLQAAESDQAAESHQAKVVLKEYVLPTQVGHAARKQSIESLQNEAAILGKLSHENVVRLIDYFVQDHRGYLVLEHVDGQDLRTKVRETGPLPETEVRTLALQMCDTLAYLHTQTPPIVHRDFTPENLILTGNGVLKLIDFNVARQSFSTVTATVVGKHAYIPPEQFRGKPEPQSDIYAMGCTLHLLLTGQDPEPLSASCPLRFNKNIDEKLDAIVQKSTQLESTDRYATVEDLRQDLLSAGAPAPRRL